VNMAEQWVPTGLASSSSRPCDLTYRVARVVPAPRPSAARWSLLDLPADLLASDLVGPALTAPPAGSDHWPGMLILLFAPLPGRSLALLQTGAGALLRSFLRPNDALRGCSHEFRRLR
jgi:hypothetical protein